MTEDHGLSCLQNNICLNVPLETTNIMDWGEIGLRTVMKELPMMDLEYRLNYIHQHLKCDNENFYKGCVNKVDVWTPGNGYYFRFEKERGEQLSKSFRILDLGITPRL